MGWLSIFGAGGVAKTVEKIATEFIDTPEEKANARALMVKTLDPSGLMRRDISQKVSVLYMMYIIVMMALVIFQSFQIGDVIGIEKAIANLSDLFIGITAMFTTIVSASFGVNLSNSIKGR